MKKPTETKCSAGDLAEVADLSRQRIDQLAAQGVIPKAKGGGYDFIPAVRALLQYYRDQAAGMTTSKAADQARKAKAEADMAEMESGKQNKTLCERAQYLANYADAIAQGVRNISKLKGLTDAQKDLVFAALSDVKLASLEDSEPEE